MAKAFMIIQDPGRVPNLSNAAGDTLPIKGYSHHYQLKPNWAIYLVGGTPAQLTALAALPQVIPVCVVSESAQSRWPELDGVISTARRTRLNGWLVASNLPTVPVGATYRQILTAIYSRVNPNHNLMSEDIAD